MRKKIVAFIIVLFVTTGTVDAFQIKEQEKASDQLIIINKQTNKLAFYDQGLLIGMYKVATGRRMALTPEGLFQVIVKEENMPYYKKNIAGGAPNNPLGPRWIGLDVPGTWGYTYGIHGNAAPWSIGTYASAGCVRMYNEKVIELYEWVKIGAKVNIVRSEESFQQIAKSINYTVHKEEGREMFVTFGKKENAYEGHHFYSKSSGMIEKGSYHVSQKIDDWYYLTEESVWVHDEMATEGKRKQEEGKLIIEDETALYESPNQKAFILGVLEDDVVYYSEKIGDWYLLKHKQDIWVHYRGEPAAIYTKTSEDYGLYRLSDSKTSSVFRLYSVETMTDYYIEKIKIAY